jgi:ADP-heptose:LPS heptosyltransferase
VGINPGADRPQKRWSPRKYAVVAHSLSERFQAEIFLLGGPGEEGLVGQIRRDLKVAEKHPGCRLLKNVQIQGPRNPEERGVLVSTSQRRGMRETPEMGVFQQPARPYTSPGLYRIVYVPVDCRPCVRKRCERPLCLELIQPEQVLEKCLVLFKRA